MVIRKITLLHILTYYRDQSFKFPTVGSYKVRLKFDAFAGQLVRERIWHPRQKIQKLADGGLELPLQLSSLLIIEPWVLSWGEHVGVIRPAGLKNRVTKRLNDALAGQKDL